MDENTNGTNYNAGSTSYSGAESSGQMNNGDYSSNMNTMNNPRNQGQGYNNYNNINGAYSSGINNNTNFNNNMNGMYNNNMYNNGQNAPSYTLWLVLGIVQCVVSLCCCGGCFGIIAGAITIILTVMANNSFKIGDVAGYSSKIMGARVANIIGWVIIVVSIIVSIVSGALTAVLELFE